MKKIIFILLLLPLFLFAQRKPFGSIHIQSADNTPFYLEIDGKRINEEPTTRILVTKLNKLQYAVKIISAADESMVFERAKFFVTNKEKEFKAFDYKLTKDKKGLKFKFLSMRPYKYQPMGISDAYRFDLSGTSEKSKKELIVKPSVRKTELVSTTSDSAKTTIEINKPKKGVKNEKIKKEKSIKDSAVVEREIISIEKPDTAVKKPISKPKTIVPKKDSSAVIKMDKKADSIGVKKNIAAKKNKATSKDSIATPVNNDKPEIRKEKITKVQDKKETPQDTVDSTASILNSKKPKVVKDSSSNIKKQSTTTKKEKSVVAKNKKDVKSTAVPEIKAPEAQKLVKDLVIVEPADWSCDHGWPMHKANFDRMLDSIALLNSDVEKLKKAKVLAQKNCLVTDQIFEIASRIDASDLRVEWIKFAYKYTIDIVHYSKLGSLIKDEKQKDQFYYFITH
ncbi:MAG: hypothetical protein RL582_1435 [Bacteroidota bacterium]